MITLEVTDPQGSRSVSFDKDAIRIGKGAADIVLDSGIFEDAHIEIVKEENQYLVFNTANDPFASVNGLPFGRKVLQSGDEIELEKVVIKFLTSEPNTQQQIALSDIDIDALMLEVSRMVPESKEDDNQESSEVIDTKRGEVDSIPVNEVENSYILEEFDDETEVWDSEIIEQQGDIVSTPPVASSWRMIVGISIALMMLGTVIFSGVYFRATGKNSQEEKKIAAGLADIAMSLTYGRMNHLTPAKQNWGDPEYIHNNLAKVLSPNLHTQAQVNNQGQFEQYPYILRVYTSRDNGRFLIIAQPAPNLLQWLVHKKSIVVDSKTMEMRKITDLKALNRLLTNPNALDGKSGNEVSRLVREGTLMPLASLAGNRNLWGFTPPKALSFIRPGAENYIYNAPRYYPFGEAILRNAVELSLSHATSADVMELQYDVGEIANLPDMVLYTTQSLQSAIEAQKSLVTFVPSSQFLIGHVKLTAQGYISSSHLIMNDEKGDVAFLDKRHRHLSYSDVGIEGEEEHRLESYEEWFSIPRINPNHPLYLRLQNLVTTRALALRPIAEEIAALVQRQSSHIIFDFNDQYETLSEEYRITDAEQQASIIESVEELYNEYSDMPLEEFMQIVKAANLSGLVDIALQSREEVSAEQIEEGFEKVGEATNFLELDSSTHDVSGMLNLEKFSDSEKLMLYQEKLRNDLIDKLTAFIFSKDSPYSSQPLGEDESEAFIHILKNARIADPEEEQYFISEFNAMQKLR